MSFDILQRRNRSPGSGIRPWKANGYKQPGHRTPDTGYRIRKRRTLKLNNSTLKCDSYCFRAIRDGELAQNTADVEFDRPLGDV